MNLSFEQVEKALKSLEKALAQPKTEFTRDAAIQRFEYTFELTWKLAKKTLEFNGITSTSPRSVIRDMGQQGWIADVKRWFSFLDARNLTSHTYKEEIADQVYETARSFAKECKDLIRKLQPSA